MIRAILVTVVLFCTSVGTASGEGRWLLWRSGREIASFDAESECRAEALLKVRATAVEEAGKPRSHAAVTGDVWLEGGLHSRAFRVARHQFRMSARLPDLESPDSALAK